MGSKGLTLATMLLVFYTALLQIISYNTNLFHFSFISYVCGMISILILAVVHKFLKEGK